MELKNYSPFTKDLQQVRKRCDEMEVIIQKLLKGQHGYQESTTPAEKSEASAESFSGSINQGFSSTSTGNQQATTDCHTLDISLGIKIYLFPF